MFQAGIDLQPGELNILPYTVWLPRLDTAHAVTIPPTTTREVVLTTPRIPGLEIHLPPGAQIRDVDGNPATEVGITAIPLDRPPFPIPHFVDVPVYFTVQPGAATVDAPSGAWVVYPNYTNLPPGTRADFWQYDPKKRGWFVYGQGTVTADGRQVVPDPNVRIYSFTGFMFNGIGWAPPAEAPQPDDGHDDGDPVNLETGLFVLEHTDLALPDTLPLTLTRTYRPRDPSVRPFGVGATHPYEIFLHSEHEYTEVDLILPNGARVHYPRTSPGTGYGDAVFEHTSTPTGFYKSRIAYVDFGWHLTLQDGTVYRFGDNGPLQWIRDRYGNTIRMLRTGQNPHGDGTGSITRLISPNGRWIAFSSAPDGRITQATDNIGRTVTYTYYGDSRLWKVTDSAGGVTEYTYDISGRMQTIKDARGIVYLTNEYDANGRVTKQTQADGTSYQFAYTLDGTGHATETDVTNPRGKIRRVTFNASRRVVSDTLALGTPEQQTVTYERRAGDNFILSVTDPLNRRATFGYDSQGNVTGVTELAGTAQARTTTLTYEPTYQQVKTVTDPLNRTTRFDYDAAGNLISVTDPLNHVTSATYDGTGRLASVKDPLNQETRLTYRGPDLVSVTDPLNRTATIRPDGAGRILAAIDPLGNKARLEYDALNQLTRIVDPLGNVTAFSYDPNGNLLRVTDARNSVTQYAYNSMDRLVTRTDPLARVESFVYDANGNVAQATDRKSQQTTASYDALDRPTQVTFADTSTIAYTYDGGSRVTQVTDSANGTTSFAYDTFDRLTSETNAQGTVSYGYDVVDRQTSMTVTGQPAVTYGYDSADGLTQISQGSTVATMAYDAADRRTSLTMPNGIVVEYSYDAASQLTGQVYRQGTTTLGNLTYTLDVLGRRARVGGSYARTGLPQALSSAGYDAANQLSQWAGTALSYDPNGSLLGDGTSTYTWDARGQLAALSGGGTTASFRYDALGRRRGRTINGAAMEYLYDGGSIVQELSGTTPTANLLHGAGIDELLVRTDGSGARNLLRDGLGSTLGLLDSGGALTASYTYEPFGQTAVAGTGSGNPSRFTGREDDGTGLYYYRARYYHPKLQRFIGEDPLGFGGGDVNLHAYVGNDPVNSTDPSGEFAPLLAACAGGALMDVGIYAGGQLLSGRKVTVGGAAQSAASGCVAGLVGLGVGRLAGALLPRVAGAIARSRAAGAICRLPNSFSGDTLVETERGQRRIDSLRAGDRVLAYDEDTGETSYQLVTATISHEDQLIVRLRLGGEQLEATTEHPFMVTGRGWVQAADLKPGDRVERAFGGTGTVTSVVFERHPQVMYNLSVDGAHTFFVGQDEWLVHNSCGDLPEGVVTNARGRYYGWLGVRVEELGRRWGCHTCGIMTPGGRHGIWIVDHDPPLALGGPPYTLRPQCDACSRSQGGLVRAITRAIDRGDPPERIRALIERLPKTRWPGP